MDATLLAELRRHWYDGEAVALHRAVAAALAHRLVDEDVPGWILEEPLLPEPASLRRAPLVVHDDGDPGDLAQPLLHLGQAVAPEDLHPARPARVPSVVPGVLGAHDDLRHALRLERPGQRRDVHEPGHVLPAGHGDGGVVQDLEGDVDVRRHAGPDGECPGVAEGPVAQVLEEVRLVDERGQAEPGHTLGPHRCRRKALHALMTRLEVHDPVTADTAAHQRIVGEDRGAIVRTAAAEGRRARRHRHDRQGRPPGRRAPRRAQLRLQAGKDRGHRLRVELADRRDQRSAVEITFARDRNRAARLVEDAAQLRFDEGSLLL